MKIIEIPFCYYPDAVGGTEVYVRSLSESLQRMGAEVVVAAPAPKNGCYVHEGIPVKRYGISGSIQDLAELYGAGDPEGAANFGRLLDQEKPDIVHFHAFTRGASLLAMREARKRKIPLVFTYHTPTVGCQRGSLMRWGSEVCEGKADARICAPCVLHAHGLPKPIAEAVSLLPAGLGRAASVCGLSGSWVTALRTRPLVETRIDIFYQMLAEADHLVAVCDWVQSVLERNGVPREKMTLSRQGVSSGRHAAATAAETHDQNLKVVYLGRLDPSKGVHVLVKAVRQLGDVGMTLDIFGVKQGESGQKYEDELKLIVSDDSRIRFHRPIAASEVPERLAAYDVMAVPSQWLETGPLVVLEAFASGLPVIGSRLGGIRELVRDGIDGVLVDPCASPERWAAMLRRMADDRTFLKRLKSGILPPRTMDAAADDMMRLYEELCGRKK